MNCAVLRVYSTPIPNIAVLSEMCQQCGWNDLVGWNGDALCGSCLDMWRADVHAEVTRHHPDFSRPTDA
jgi:hypothetical protein